MLLRDLHDHVQRIGIPAAHRSSLSIISEVYSAIFATSPGEFEVGCDVFAWRKSQAMYCQVALENLFFLLHGIEPCQPSLLYQVSLACIQSPVSAAETKSADVHFGEPVHLRFLQFHQELRPYKAVICSARPSGTDVHDLMNDCVS